MMYDRTGTLMIGMVGCPDRMNPRPAVTPPNRLIISDLNTNFVFYTTFRLLGVEKNG